MPAKSPGGQAISADDTLVTAHGLTLNEYSLWLVHDALDLNALF